MDTEKQEEVKNTSQEESEFLKVLKEVATDIGVDIAEVSRIAMEADEL